MRQEIKVIGLALCIIIIISVVEVVTASTDSDEDDDSFTLPTEDSPVTEYQGISEEASSTTTMIIANTTTTTSLPNDLCNCPLDQFVPVCASNGRQYANECIFNCYAQNDTSLTIAAISTCNIMHIHKRPKNA